MSGGPVSATGKRLTADMCAANREIPFGVVIWTPWGLRVVEDRGGMVRLSRCGPRESAFFDYFTSHDIGQMRNAPYAIIGPARAVTGGLYK
ncbi:MAG: hypothetical protein H5T86_15245 [Armatimonadetes bacterium]|nr:hypothetical protein [Armatimonadota bacterium]